MDPSPLPSPNRDLGDSNSSDSDQVGQKPAIQVEWLTLPGHIATDSHPASGSWTTRTLVMLLGCLVGISCLRLFGPWIAEELQYAVTRGRQRAEFELAGEQLHKMSALTDLSRSYELIMQRIGPSVVHINTAEQALVRRAEGEFGWRSGLLQENEGLGSGVIVDANGLILTNFHVVERAERIDVTLADDRTIKAYVVGADPKTDLALLKIDADKLIPCEFGDSHSLREGALVWAIGSPFGLSRSITSGIVSATNRSRVAGHPDQDLLQTDAALNPGNSGGPLVNAQGQVIGINTAIYGQQFGGISFAIPSHVAVKSIQWMLENERPVVGYLGIGMQTIDPPTAKRLGFDRSDGVLVGIVRGRSPAKRAGITVDDIVLQWNGITVDSPAQLRQLVEETPVDSTAEVLIFRDGAEQSISVKVGHRPLQLP